MKHILTRERIQRFEERLNYVLFLLTPTAAIVALLSVNPLTQAILYFAVGLVGLVRAGLFTYDALYHYWRRDENEKKFNSYLLALLFSLGGLVTLGFSCAALIASVDKLFHISALFHILHPLLFSSGLALGVLGALCMRFNIVFLSQNRDKGVKFNRVFRWFIIGALGLGLAGLVCVWSAGLYHFSLHVAHALLIAVGFLALYVTASTIVMLYHKRCMMKSSLLLDLLALFSIAQISLIVVDFVKAGIMSIPIWPQVVSLLITVIALLFFSEHLHWQEDISIKKSLYLECDDLLSCSPEMGGWEMVLEDRDDDLRSGRDDHVLVFDQSF